MKPFLPLLALVLSFPAALAGQQQASTQPLRSTPVLTQALTGDPELAGKAVTISRLELAPGALLTDPHTHPAELFGYVLEGAVLTGLNNAPPQRYETGQVFYEYRGVTHTHFQNASETQPARVLVVRVADDVVARRVQHASGVQAGSCAAR
jgi:quercetin dioxygenase-like cupin family protein